MCVRERMHAPAHTHTHTHTGKIPMDGTWSYLCHFSEGKSSHVFLQSVRRLNETMFSQKGQVKHSSYN